MIRISKKLEWIRKPVESVIKDFKIRHLIEIKAYRHSRKRKQNTWGYTLATNGTFQITIATHSQPHEDKRRKLRKLSRLEVLKNLAHELAHCVTWKHSKKHDSVTQQISAALAKSYRAAK